MSLRDVSINILNRYVLALSIPFGDSDFIDECAMDEFENAEDNS